jgi:hypothetical protein
VPEHVILATALAACILGPIIMAGVGRLIVLQHDRRVRREMAADNAALLFKYAPVLIRLAQEEELRAKQAQAGFRDQYPRGERVPDARGVLDKRYPDVFTEVDVVPTWPRCECCGVCHDPAEHDARGCCGQHLGPPVTPPVGRGRGVLE